MELTHHSYILCAVVFKFLVDTQVEAISFTLGLGATYFGSEVYAESNCYKAAHQKFDSPCYVAEGEAFLCDHKEFLRCSNGTCVCFRGYSYNSISKMCEPDHSKHLVRRKREPGKALPGETCHLSGDCVEGLYCIADKCHCPNPCEYKKDEGVCDCGEIDFEFPIAAKVLTAVLSILSVCMWTYFILKTKNKHKNTPTNTDENFDVNGPLEMNPLNQPNKPELVGENNFLVPSDLPPSYQESMEGRNDCAPFYPPSNDPVANNMSAWKVTPMPSPQNMNTTLTSQYPVSTPYSYGATSDDIHSNDGVSSSSVLSPENVTLIDASKSQGATLPYPVSSQNISTPFTAPFAGVHSAASSDATHPNTSSALPLASTGVPATTPSDTSKGISLPYAINPQTMSSTLPPPSTGVPAATSTNATYPNTCEGTSLPYSINPPSAPPSTTEN